MRVSNTINRSQSLPFEAIRQDTHDLHCIINAIPEDEASILDSLFNLTIRCKGLHERCIELGWINVIRPFSIPKQNWGLTKKQIEMLHYYLYSLELLVECLALSVVKNHKMVINQLLLLPD